MARNGLTEALLGGAVAIVVAAVLRIPAAHRPALLAGAYLANVAASLLTGDDLGTALALSACNTIEVLLCALPLARFRPLCRIHPMRGYFGAGVKHVSRSMTVGGVFRSVSRPFYRLDSPESMQLARRSGRPPNPVPASPARTAEGNR